MIANIGGIIPLYIKT